MRRGCTLGKWMHGAGHEAGRRAGTENTMHLVALGEACRQCQEHAQQHESHLKSMRDLLHALLLQKLPGLRLNGPVEGREKERKRKKKKIEIARADRTPSQWPCRR